MLFQRLCTGSLEEAGLTSTGQANCSPASLALSANRLAAKRFAIIHRVQQTYTRVQVCCHKIQNGTVAPFCTGYRALHALCCCSKAPQLKRDDFWQWALQPGRLHGTQVYVQAVQGCRISTHTFPTRSCTSQNQVTIRPWHMKLPTKSACRNCPLRKLLVQRDGLREPSRHIRLWAPIRCPFASDKACQQAFILLT